MQLSMTLELEAIVGPTLRMMDTSYLAAQPATVVLASHVISALRGALMSAEMVRLCPSTVAKHVFSSSEEIC